MDSGLELLKDNRKLSANWGATEERRRGMSEAISRRKALSIFAVAGLLGLTASALTESEADAQEAAPAPAATTSGTKGMKRRHHRRATRSQRHHNTGKPAAATPAPQ
jgi:hypothetical protein